jgi:hypothetical protein
VFVVAADREVLEEALVAVEQATPMREAEPYYSSASAFLDKIFQHQIALPPLRTGRLTWFARELVEGRGGLWSQIQSAEPNGRRLDAVIHALIPSHVRSPRRVKVLLNNFATNVRVIESCGIPWEDRAAEIAKLTVLQTEFPRLAADLLLEPRLPALLLEPPQTRSERQAELLSRHWLLDESPPPAASAAPSADPDANHMEAGAAEDPDRLIVAGAEDTSDVLQRRLASLRNRQRSDLLRYLKSRSAAGVPDPGRDLLYLEDAGQVVDLGDPELSQLLEDWAAEDPDRVCAVLRQRPAEQRIAAARMLGSMADRDVGPERVNTMTAMTQALERISPSDLAGRIGDLIAIANAYLVDESATEAQLPGLLTLAVCAGEPGDALRERVLGDERMFTDGRCLAGLPPLLPYLSERDADRAGASICMHYPSRPKILIVDILNDAPIEIAKQVLAAGTDDLVYAIEQINTPPEPAAGTEEPAENPAVVATSDLLDGLIPRLGDLGAEGDRLLEALIIDGPDVAFTEIDSRLDDIAGAVGPGERLNRLCLAGLTVSEPGAWDGWSSHLHSATPMGNGIAAAASHIIAIYLADPKTVGPATTAALPRVIGTGSLEALPADTINQAGTALGALDFWSSDDAFAVWEQAHQVIEMLATAVPGEADGLAQVVADDIRRAANAAWDSATPTRVTRAGFIARDPGLVAAGAVLEGTGVTRAAASDLTVAAATEQLKVAGRLADRGLPVPELDPVTVGTIAGLATTAAAEAVAGWLRTDPMHEDVLHVIARASYEPRIVSELRDWASRLPVGQCSTTYLAAVDDPAIAPQWFKPLGGIPVERDVVLEALTARFKTTAAHPDRERLAEAISALRPEGFAEGRIVADATIRLLLEDSKVTSDEAVIMIPALQRIGNYGRKTQLASAAAQADKKGHVSKRARAVLEEAGFLAAKKRKGIVDRMLGR